MNTTFNINRLGLLLKRFFIENKQRQLTFWSIAILVFMLLHQTGSVLLFMSISGFIFAAIMFSHFKHTPGGIHYLMIPATHFEKLVTAILLSTVYYFIMILITYVIGDFIGTHLGNFIFNTHNEVDFGLFHMTRDLGPFAGKIPSHNIFDVFVGFATVQSIFLLGSLYFKSNPVGKTFLAIAIFTLAITLLEIWFLKHNFDTDSFRHLNLQVNVFDSKKLLPGFDKVVIFLKYATAPFFWVVSYFRLKEKEV